MKIENYVMKLVKINKEQLNSFVGSQKHSQFLQSYEWGEFQGNVLRYGMEDNGKIIFAFSLLEKKLLLNKKYFYCPRVNLEILNNRQEEFLFNEIKKLTKRDNVVFVRVEPVSKFPISNPPAGRAGFQLPISKTIDIQASKTSILDISRGEDEILKSMHQKTRYNIRLAERKGVRVRVGDKDDFEKFWEIINETKNRDGFRLHAKEHYQKMLDLDFVELIIAEYKNDIIAANIVSYFGDMASYLHGSSSDKYRNVMAPFAIQWFTIKYAKSKNIQYYDFNGVDEKKWPGVTRFKRGFNGIEINYPGAFDVVFDSSCYKKYQLLRKIRRIIGRIIKK